MATVNEELAQRNTAATNTYNERQAQAQQQRADSMAEAAAVSNARLETAKNTEAQRQAEATKTYNQRQAENQGIYNQRQSAAQSQYSSDLNAAAARRSSLISNAQSVYNQRNAEAQAEYEKRREEGAQYINGMYDDYLEAQKQQYKTALDQGIYAQEEARADIAKSYQTAANDLSTQAERNKRNLNMQAMAHGLNTGTGSQQQLAANQAYMKSYGNLRGEEAAQNASIDRAIAQLKVDYENNIAQALADNNFQRAAALLDDYKTQVSWLDSQRNRNQDYLDNWTMYAENVYDTAGTQARGYLNTSNMYNLQSYDTGRANNQSYLDTLAQANRARYDSLYDQSTSQYDAERMASRNSYENALANAQNYLDTQRANNQNWADSQNRLNTEYAREDAQRAEAYAREDKQYNDKQALLKADTLASYGDFSGYASLYGQDTANLMKQMWINQNPQMAWQAGLIDDATYLRWLTGPQGEAGGGGGGGGYYGGTPQTPPETGSFGEGEGKEYRGSASAANPNSANAFERGVASSGSATNSGSKSSFVSKTGFTPSSNNTPRKS